MDSSDNQIKSKKDNQIKSKNDDNNYGVCRWSDERKIDSKGSNCPEYLFMRVFMKGIFK